MSVNLLLFRKSLRTGWGRLVLVTGSVAIGIWITLSFTAVFNPTVGNKRTYFPNNINQQLSKPNKSKQKSGVDPVEVGIDNDTSGNDATSGNITIYNMRKTGVNAPNIVGLRVPDAGEYYVSPALAEIIKQNPDDHIGSRYGTKLIGTLPESVLLTRDTLMVIRGISDDETIASYGESADDETTGTNLVYQFSTKVPVGLEENALEKVVISIVYMGVIIVLLPVVMLISISAKLGSVQREKRYAALRLVGATNSQIINIMATESLASAVIGVTIGSALYLVSLPAIQQFSIEGSRFWPDAVTVTWLQYCAITILTLLLVWLANWWGMRNIHTSPLGITKNDHREKKPGWWRVIPLFVGLGIVIWLNTYGKFTSWEQSGTNVQFLMLAIVIIMAGLILAGPWLAYVLSKLSSKIVRKPTAMIGTKYVQSHARSVSRSVIGITLALFAGSFFIASTSGISRLTDIARQANGYAIIDHQTAMVSIPNLSTSRSVKQIDLTNVEQKLRGANYLSNIGEMKEYGPWTIGRCTTAQRHVPKLDCQTPGHNYVAIRWDIEVGGKGKITYLKDKVAAIKLLRTISNEDKDKWMSELMVSQLTSATSLDDLDPDGTIYLVTTKDASIDKLRTLTTSFDSTMPFSIQVTGNKSIHSSQINPAISRLSALVYAGMLLTMTVATISIVVSTIGGLLERKRSLFTLYLSGMQINELKKMVLIESVLPLVVTSLISAGLGLYVSYVFTLTNSTTLRVSVTPLYVAIIAGSITVAIVAIYAVLPLIKKVTNPANNQAE